MALRLRDDLYWCDCMGRAVFLDVRADRYFCLPGQSNDAFLRLAAGNMLPEDSERLNMLAARGLLIESPVDVPFPSPPAVEPPTCDYPARSHSGARLIEISRALSFELRASWLLRSGSFRAVIALLRKRTCRRPSRDPDRSIRAIVEASVWGAILTRAHDRCLVRGISAHLACRDRGIASKLVFGVIAHPFTAHCWVQLGSTVLVGGYEQARLFTPILVVE
jgi:hypothetical protein